MSSSGPPSIAPGTDTTPSCDDAAAATTQPLQRNHRMADDHHQDVDAWCISVKTVGGGFDDCLKEGALTSGGERLFSVTVCPEDCVASLHQEIEGATGVRASEQRLIYRGRLIGTNDEAETTSHGTNRSSSSNKNLDGNDPVTIDDSHARKIKDIAGLCDGQTIHLVKKRGTASSIAASESASDAAASSTARRNENGSGTRDSIEGDLFSGSDGIGGGALLAALLGLGSLTEENEDRQQARLSASNASAAVPGGGSTPGTPNWRSSRLSGSSRSRRPHYRLSAEDLEGPDPGSMEPVRQGLMTLHTLLPHSPLQQDLGISPLEANREWFRGQWLDCRDTVNQWLEAVVMEVLYPQDILPSVYLPSQSTAAIRGRRLRSANVENDPAVSANDLEGRRRLLLEPCGSGDAEELSGELAGYRLRTTNDGVQLLLVSYPGWPRRWDEWIRSDSERIRPFRTRTRHPVSSSTASPTLQAVFNDSPRTNMRDGDDEEDRLALLPELNRALSQVAELLGALIQRGGGSNRSNSDDADLESLRVSNGQSRRVQPDLPWASEDNDDYDVGEDSIITSLQPLEAAVGEATAEPRRMPCNIVEPTEGGEEEEDGDNAPHGNVPGPLYNQRELRSLAAILDRLGRTLTDAAPHVASLAASSPPEATASLPAPAATSTGREPNQSMGPASSAPLGGLLSLWSRERRRQTAEEASTTAQVQASVPALDPDHSDYSGSLVNTTRGEIRSGPRGRASQDDVANLLGAYLAAASLGSLMGSDDDNSNDNGIGLGRLLRDRGAGGVGGIDIHIHAVVTAPGVTPGGLGITTLGGGGISPTGTVAGTRNLFSVARGGGSRSGGSLLRSRNSQSSINLVPEADDDHTDLFSELYSENPTPIDPNGSPGPRERPNGTASPDRIRTAINDFSSRISRDELPLADSLEDPSLLSSQRRNRSSQSSPRRHSTDRRSGMFRLFRRRSRSNQNQSENDDP